MAPPIKYPLLPFVHWRLYLMCICDSIWQNFQPFQLTKRYSCFAVTQHPHGKYIANDQLIDSSFSLLTRAFLSTARTTVLPTYNRTFRNGNQSHHTRSGAAPLSSTITTLTKPNYYDAIRTQQRNFHQVHQCLISRQMSDDSGWNVTRPAEDVPPGVFRGEVDRFRGVTVSSRLEFDQTKNFVEKLKKSLEYWRKVGRRAIWFVVDKQHSEWIPFLIQNGFTFHHVRNGRVALYTWLPPSEPNIPHFCHTMVGVGGLVVNEEKDELLAVSDIFAMIPGSWKFPGGYVDPGENIVEGAIREVREETGIETTFISLVSFRHSHGSQFGCSDIYVVVALKPTTFKIKKCEREVAKAEWMPIKEFLSHRDVYETNRKFLEAFLELRERGLTFVHNHNVHKYFKKEYSIFYVTGKKDSKK